MYQVFAWGETLSGYTYCLDIVSATKQCVEYEEEGYRAVMVELNTRYDSINNKGDVSNG